jgi:hypothetical protein
MKKIVLMLTVAVSLNAHAAEQPEENLGKRFVAGVGAGAVSVPLAPLVLFGALYISMDRLSHLAGNISSWGRGEPMENIGPKWSRGDKVEFAGAATGFIGTPLVILKSLRFLRK